jgi:hypothetical protein
VTGHAPIGPRASLRTWCGMSDSHAAMKTGTSAAPGAMLFGPMAGLLPGLVW